MPFGLTRKINKWLQILSRKVYNHFMRIKKGFIFIFLIYFLLPQAVKSKENPSFQKYQDEAKSCQKISEKAQKDKCYRGILQKATHEKGTQFAVDLLVFLREIKIIDAVFDDHQHVHEIGRATAKYFGINIDSFLACPSTYNYGCQHGFFEYALSQKSSYKEAITSICENLAIKKSAPKLYSYCYHGAGHGLMMALSYDLEKSLDICNSLPSKAAVEGCWQGTFMENSNAAVADEKKVLSFSKSDPLAPCDKVAQEYKWQCYINHAGYLMKVTNLDVNRAVKICLSAYDGGAKPCLQSIGLMTTNPIWQKSVKGVDTVNDPKKNVETAWSICSDMPAAARPDCVIGAVDNILNFDEIKIDRATAFCQLVGDELKPICFKQIGTTVSIQLQDKSMAKQICGKIKENKGVSNCLAGAYPEGQEVEVLSLINDDNFLKKKIKESGPKAVVSKLSEVMPPLNLSCHDRSHEVGRFTYEIFGNQAFKLCSSECHSGCYHGATEAFFKDKGTANLNENLNIICSGELNRFFSHQCIHGVGHGLMAWSNYDLPDALSTCEKIKSQKDQFSCFTGVFMENIVGSLAFKGAGEDISKDRHYTKYLNDDPHFPCNYVAEKYKAACYFLQTSRMRQIFSDDFAKIAASCSSISKKYQNFCFASMGRDASGVSKQEPAAAISQCQFAPFGLPRQECLSGAVQDTFWDPKGVDRALFFCKSLKDKDEIRRCYETIIQRSSEILTGEKQEAFCKKIPAFQGIKCPQEKTIESFVQEKVKPTQLQEKITAPASVTTFIIKMTASGFSPEFLKVKKGTKIIFKNEIDDIRWPASNIHPTHDIYPEFDPKKPIKKGQSWSFTFDKIGIWQFHDHIYPYLTGKITVE